MRKLLNLFAMSILSLISCNDSNKKDLTVKKQKEVEDCFMAYRRVPLKSLNDSIKNSNFSADYVVLKNYVEKIRSTEKASEKLFNLI